MKRLFLIDGHSLIFRMYYAFLRRPMINSKGEDTSILYGFMKYLLELIKRENPTHIGVAFDPPCKTFRHEIFPPYKSNRSATPELIKDALEPLIELVGSLGIPVLMLNGFEADDVIGTFATKASERGFDVFMVSPDKDLGQLISEHIFQYKPGKSGAEDEVIGVKEICEKFAISQPSQVIDILTLWGDSSDNVPGVRGVGEVSAKKLISKYGSVEMILEHLSELSPKQAAAFEEAKTQIPLSKLLVTIKRDVPIVFEEEALILKSPSLDRCKELFHQYEFPSLFKLIPPTIISAPQKEVETYEKDNSIDSGDNSACKNYIRIKEATASEIYELAKVEKMVGIKISNDKNQKLKLYLSFEEVIFSTEDFYEVKELLKDETISKVGYSLKEYTHILNSFSIALKGKLYDIELLHYLLNPERTHRIEILSKTYLNIDIEELSQKGSMEDNLQNQESVELDLFSNITEGNSHDSNDEDNIRHYRNKVEASILVPLFRELYKYLHKDESLISLYDQVEEPLLKVLSKMEEEGFKIDTRMLLEYKGELLEKMNAIQDRIRERADDPLLNISSPKQVGVLLYEKLNLNPKVKKNSNNSYPTDEETLLSMADRHPVIEEILEFRGLKKLISTYIEPFPTLINPKSGKIHTTFNQALTATGRLSSVKPNLQNIPIRTDLGKEIRKAFIPSHIDGYIVSADYSQIELRLMASMSGDKELIDAFNDGKDVHTSTAAKVFKVSEDEVSKEQRRKAKMVNFGIIYGISSFGLSQRLQIPRKESKEIIEEYFKHFPRIKEYIEEMKEGAKKSGYVKTLCGRKRYLPDINSKNVNVRALAERNAINAPIQGSAADIIKLAMIKVDQRLSAQGLKSKMILQVHDELIIDTHPDELEIVMGILKSEMEGVFDIGIPLTVECSYGKNWLEAH